MVEVVWGNSSTDWGEEMMKGSNDFNQNLTLLHWKKYPLVTSGDGENWDELDLITNAQIMQGKNAEYMILTDNEYFAQRTSEFSSIPVHTLLFLSCSRLVQNCWYMLELLEHGGTVGGNANSRAD